MRILFLAWQSPNTRTIHPVARVLEKSSSPHYELAYIGGVRAAQEEGFMPFVRMKDLHKVYRSDELFPLLSNRVMPTTREDYAEYLQQLDLEAPVEPIALLARSQGRKATDNLELFAPPCFNSDENRWVHLFFARGIRHIPDAEKAVQGLRQGQGLIVRVDKENTHDSRALLMFESEGGAKLGFVPKTLLDDLDTLRKAGSTIEACVARMNPLPAPVHQRLLVRLSIDDQADYAPFQTELYQPIAKDATPFKIDTKSYAC